MLVRSKWWFRGEQKRTVLLFALPLLQENCLGCWVLVTHSRATGSPITWGTQKNYYFSIHMYSVFELLLWFTTRDIARWSICQQPSQHRHWTGVSRAGSANQNPDGPKKMLHLWTASRTSQKAWKYEDFITTGKLPRVTANLNRPQGHISFPLQELWNQSFPSSSFHNFCRKAVGASLKAFI